jgi:antitoxin StbD
MAELLTRHIATITELREPHKVLERADGKPVAILRNSAVVAYLVPAEAVEVAPGHHYATREELLRHIEATRTEVQPVLDYLKDK